MWHRLMAGWVVMLVGWSSAEAATPPNPEQQAIESRYLAEARAGIERHRKSDARLVVRDAQGRPVAGARVQLAQETHAFHFGALSDGAWSPKFNPAEVARFRELFLDLFNFTIAKVYWSGFEKQQGRPDWARLDDFLRWCREHELTVKGHPLGWTHPAGTPNWLLALPEDQATTLLQARIYNLVRGYRGAIDQWDVINEPVTTVPWSVAMRDTENTDYSIAEGARYQVDGITTAEIVPWVRSAFQWANEANPDGHFVLNDFFLMSRPAVRQRFHALVSALLAEKVPVRGLGIQAHEPRDMWFSPAQIREALDHLAEFGLPLHITEFIPQSSGQAITGWRSGTWTVEAQAEFAEQLYTMAFGHPAVESINWWSFSDRDTWLVGGGLVDEALQPKPVYHRLKALIKGEWMTRHEAVTDGSGGMGFRGFHGRYRVEVTPPGRPTVTRTISLAAGADNVVAVVLD
jgi:endo-1,4-beta-xylanase